MKASADNWLVSQRDCQVNAVIYRSVRIKQMTPLAFDEIIYAPTVINAGYPAGWGFDVIDTAPGPTSLATFASQLLAKFGEGGTDPTLVAGIYSRTIGGDFPFTLAGWQPITRWDPQPVVGNQRRRRLFVGI